MKKRKISKIMAGICFGAALLLGSGTAMSQATEAGNEIMQKNIIASGQYKENGAAIDWALNASGLLTVRGQGALEAKTRQINDYQIALEAPWVTYAHKIREVSMSEGITLIGHNIFADCTNLRSITIPNSVKMLRDMVFYGCSSLETVNLGSGVTEVGTNVFCYSGIKSLTIPKQLTKINQFTLNYMEKLENIQVEPGNPKFSSKDGILYSDGGRTLFRCPTNRQGNLTIPNGVTKLNDDAFFQCALTSVNMPSSLTTLGESVFRECENLTTLVFPDKITELPMWTCLYCHRLQQVTLPSGLKKIGNEAFQKCEALTQIVIPSSVTSIGSNAFSEFTQVDWSNNDHLEDLGNGAYKKLAHVKIKVNEDYQKAFKVLELVNKERAKAGCAPLTMDRELLDAAMLRGAESVLYWDHVRPNGLDCFSASRRMMGENLALGNTTPESVVASWMNSPGHKANILSTGYKSIGVGCIEIDDTYFWVQCFGPNDAQAVSHNTYANRKREVRIQVDPDHESFQPLIGVTKKQLKKGERLPINFKWNNGFYLQPLDASVLIAESSTPSVITVSNGEIYAVQTGKALVSLYVEGCPEKKKVFEFFVENDNSNSNNNNTSADNHGSSNSSRKKVTVVWNARGGKLSPRTSKVTHKKSYGKLPAPTKKGYSFEGWYTKANGGTKVTSKTKVTKSKKHTLYARWKKLTVGKASFSSVKNVKSKKLKLQIKPLKGVKNYQVVYSTNPKFKKGVKKITFNSRSGIIKNLKKGKTYYVKVRGFRKDSTGKKIYGKYSSIKKISIKR